METVPPAGGTPLDGSRSQAERLEAARAALAVGPPLRRGLLRVTGSRRLEFLHRMATQKVVGLAPPQSIYSAFLDPRARVVAEGVIVVRPDDVLVDVDSAAAPALKAHLDKFVLREDVRVAELDEPTRVVPLLGPRAEQVARAQQTAWPNPRRGAPAWDVLAPAGGWESLRESLLAMGAVALSEEDLEALRIAAGVPRWGAEIDGGRLVMEAALTGPAVHFEKGCYLGQEIVLRGTFRGQIQRGLVQLELPAAAGPGAALRDGDQQVGAVTSATTTAEGRLGLGYLRRAHWRPGTRLATEGGEAIVRRVLVEEHD